MPPNWRRAARLGFAHASANLVGDEQIDVVAELRIEFAVHAARREKPLQPAHGGPSGCCEDQGFEPPREIESRPGPHTLCFYIYRFTALYVEVQGVLCGPKNGLQKTCYG
jgi:hypothetical protein